MCTCAKISNPLNQDPQTNSWVCACVGYTWFSGGFGGFGKLNHFGLWRFNISHV